MVNAREELEKIFARWADKSDRVVTAIPGLTLNRRDEPSEPTSMMYEPRVCVIAQGANAFCSMNPMQPHNGKIILRSLSAELYNVAHNVSLSSPTRHCSNYRGGTWSECAVYADSVLRNIVDNQLFVR